MINPFKVKIYQGQKYFYVNPDYANIFNSMGLNSGKGTFFKANPFEGLHSLTDEDEPPFQYFENNIESHRTGLFLVKKNELPLLHGKKISPEQVEKHFEELEVSAEYILRVISSSNEWAKTNYPEAYHPDLENSIAQYKKNLKAKEY